MKEEELKRVATLQARLDMKLGPEFVSSRAGPGGGPKLLYIEGWKVINIANEVFGFNGWSSSITRLDVDFIDTVADQRYSVGVTAAVKVTLPFGTYHEDVGYGSIENMKSKGQAIEKVMLSIPTYSNSMIFSARKRLLQMH